jgi:hypothetical protein
MLMALAETNAQAFYTLLQEVRPVSALVWRL